MLRKCSLLFCSFFARWSRKIKLAVMFEPLNFQPNSLPLTDNHASFIEISFHIYSHSSPSTSTLTFTHFTHCYFLNFWGKMATFYVHHPLHHKILLSPQDPSLIWSAYYTLSSSVPPLFVTFWSTKYTAHFLHYFKMTGNSYRINEIKLKIGYLTK